MNHDYLHAWMEGHHAGVFERINDEIRFSYDENLNHPISLSMPRDGGWLRKAPIRFLENLLPDDPAMRTVMAISTHADPNDVFDLLDKTDTTGGMVLSKLDEPPEPESTLP